MYQGWKSVVRRKRPAFGPHASRATRGLAAGAVTVALVGAQLAVPTFASADTTPGAPVVTASAEPPAGTQSCQMPADGGPSTLAMGTVCSFTLSPNPADSAAADGTWQFGINTAGTTAATYDEDDAGSWTAGTWTHVVLTYDASTGHLVLYVDGDRADTVHVSSAAAVDGPFLVGANQTGGAVGSYFPGEVARVVTFDSALTVTEVKQLP